MKKFLLLILPLAVLVSCKSRKHSGQTLSYQQRVKFNEHYFEATKEKALGNGEGAFKEFQSAYKIDPASHAVMYQLANLSFKNKNLTEAIYWGEKAVKANPEYNHWYFGQLAQFYNRDGKFEKSAEIFSHMIDKDPNRSSNYLEAANQYVNAADYKNAARVLTQYQTRFGIDEESARKLEQLYIKLKKPEQAVKEIAKLTQASPDEVRYWGLLAETQMSLNKRDDARVSYQKIISLDSLNGYAHFGLADILRAEGKNDESFIHLLAGFKDDRVNMVNKLQVISSYYVLMQKDEKSRRQVFQLGEALLQAHPNDAMSYVVYSDLLYANGSLNESRNYLIQSLKYDNADFKVWQKLLSVDEQLLNMAWLEEDSRKAIDIFPNIPSLYIYNGFALIALKKFDASIQISTEGLNYAIQQKDKIQILLNIADASQQKGNYAVSDKAFEDVLKMEPENTLALNNYAYFLSLRKEKLDYAETLVKKALALEPNSPSYLDTYGWILYQSARYNEALEILKKAVAASPDNAEILEHYGDVLFKTGKNAEAREQWKKALEKNQDDESLKQKVNKGLLE